MALAILRSGEERQAGHRLDVIIDARLQRPQLNHSARGVHFRVEVANGGAKAQAISSYKGDANASRNPVGGCCDAVCSTGACNVSQMSVE